MDQTLQDVEIENICGGAAPDLFQQALLKVMENIEDPNTAFKKKRSITLTFTLEPTSEERDDISVQVDVAAKLAPHIPTAGRMFIGTRDGQVVAVNFDPRQGSLFGDSDSSVHPLHKQSTQ